MTSTPQRAAFGDVHAEYDVFSARLFTGDGDPHDRVDVTHDRIAELVFALRRRDGLLSPLELTEGPDGSVDLSWSDYDIDERPVGGAVRIPAEQVEPLTAWIEALELPSPHLKLADHEAEHHANFRQVVYDLSAGLPDTVTYDERTYRLWARDDAGVGLYRLPHSDLADPLRWLRRDPDGALSPSGRPQAPDRHGTPRRYLQPHPDHGQQWIWVRIKP